MGTFLAAIALLTVPLLRSEAQVPSLTDEPRVGGICLTCPSFDYGPFTPTATWQTHASALVGGIDCAWYAFDVTAGLRYEFKTCGAEGSATWDSVLELYDSSCGTWIARNDQGCAPGSGASDLLWDATFSGRTYLKVRPFGTTSPGAYTLAYRSFVAPCETCWTPTATLPLTGACTCVSGATTSTCPSDYYTVALVAGETYEFTTCPLNCASAGATFDTFLRVLGPDCAQVTSNDDSCALAGSTTRSTIRTRPPSPAPT